MGDFIDAANGMAFLALLVAVEVGIPIAVSLVLKFLAPQISNRIVVTLAALPLALPMVGFALVRIYQVQTMASDECGIDFCGMMAAVALMVGAFGIGTYWFGRLAAVRGIKIWRRLGK